NDVGLIGGTNGLNAYAAVVCPDGKVAPYMGLIAPGEIYTVDLNDSGRGIVGGGHFDSNVPYAALVSTRRNIKELDVPASGLIYGVAINESQQGIIGGIGPLKSAYAALVSSNGDLERIRGLPRDGAIYWVAINASGRKFIGGQDGDSIYAAFVSPRGHV